MTIKLANVQYHYPNQEDKVILNISSWSVSQGEQVFIHGPSGSGKSTLLNLLSGLIPASRGEINILGQKIEKMTSRQRDRFRANNIGYVFQQFNLIPYLNALDNVRLVSEFAESKKTSTILNRIKKLLTTLNITSEDWATPIRHLSVGQQQRVAIARALINKPPLLIADEPTSSLDQSNRDIFMSLLMSMVENSNTTLLFVSHDMSLSKYFKRVESLSDINCLQGDN